MVEIVWDICVPNHMEVASYIYIYICVFNYIEVASDICYLIIYNNTCISVDCNLW